MLLFGWLGILKVMSTPPKKYTATELRERLAQLQRYFAEVNDQHFDGFLEVPVLRWNIRLRSSAGRFIPGARQWLYERSPVIEVASYLLEEAEAEKHIRDTVAHEMIHYWLWVRRKPYGHTDEFWRKMTEMGVSRYNPVPRLRPPKYLYRCPHCQKDFPAKRTLSRYACSDCCKRHAGGKFDPRFRLLRVSSEMATIAESVPLLSK